MNWSSYSVSSISKHEADRFQVDAFKPLGAIVRDLEEALDNSMPGELRGRHVIDGEFDPAASIEVWSSFDQKYHRSDYLLWRVALRPNFRNGHPWFASRVTEFCSRADLSYLARVASNNIDDQIVWGAIGIAAEIARTHYMTTESSGSDTLFVTELFSYLRNRLSSGLRPVPRYPRSCAFAAATFLRAFQYVQHKEGVPFGIERLSTFLREATAYLETVDETWRPGRKLITKPLELEHNSNARLQPYHSLVQFEELVKLLRAVRTIVAPTIKRIDSNSERLLSVAADFAYSAWLTAKSLRIDQQQFEQQSIVAYDVNRPTKRLQIAERVESDSLLELHHALKDAGAWLEAAYYLHIHMRIASDQLIASDDYKYDRSNKSEQFRLIKEAGLEIDGRLDDSGFRHARQQRPRIALVQETLKRKSGKVASSRDLLPSVNWGRSDLPRKRSKSGVREIDRLRLSSDQANDQDWRIVLQDIPKLAEETSAGYLTTICRAGADTPECAELISSETLCCIYRIASRYGRIRSAFKIFKRLLGRGEFIPTPDDLMRLLGALVSCMQVNPLALKASKVHAWQGIIFAAMIKLEAGDPSVITPVQRLQLHEVLMGRATVNRSKATLKTSQLLFEKGLGVHSARDIRQLYLKDLNFRRRGGRLVRPTTLSALSKHFFDTELGSPVLVSVLRRGDCFSIVTVNPEGKLQAPAQTVEIEGFARDAATFKRRKSEWFIDRNAHPSQQVIWPTSFSRLVEHVFKNIQKDTVPVRSIILAISPELTAFPLQHLFYALHGAVVSFVPCLGWAPLHRRGDTDHRKALNFSISKQGDVALESVGPLIEGQLRAVSDLPFNARVLFGHGKVGRGSSFPQMQIGKGSIGTLDAWSSALRRKVVVVHACQTAHQEVIFPRDFAGLPGVGLGLGCRALFAPITDVLPDVAEVLNRNLFCRDAPEQIGSRYLAAIRELPSVCLYNLYGVASESIFVNVHSDLGAIGSSERENSSDKLPRFASGR